MYDRYDESKWSIPLINDSGKYLLDYITKKLFPFPASIHFNKNEKAKECLLIYAEYMCPLNDKKAKQNENSTSKVFFDIMSDISEQLEYYETNYNISFIGFDRDDIVKICVDENESRYLIISDKYICKMHPCNKQEVQLVYLPKVPTFCSKEVENKVSNKQFPMILHAKCGYYGFGKYMEAIWKEELDGGKKTMSEKLRGFLKRCLEPDEDARRLLYL